MQEDIQVSDNSSDLLAKVREHWEDEVCGSRYGRESGEEDIDLDLMAEERYRLEPYIPEFANFERGKGKEILEIGVGGGVDFFSWVKAGGKATGIDLTDAGISLTKRRLEAVGISKESYSLNRGNAESLTFEDASFDIVYSYGVLMCTPDTKGAFRETHRVLKQGGDLVAMVYHVPSVTGWLFWIRYCFLTGRWFKTPRTAMYENLESSGTKTYTVGEMRSMLEDIGFVDIELSTKLVFGDLLLNKPSAKYQSPIYSIIWKFYPRWLIKMLGDKFGLFLFINARK